MRITAFRLLLILIALGLAIQFLQPLYVEHFIRR
jgi:hypothetical protein